MPGNIVLNLLAGLVPLAVLQAAPPLESAVKVDKVTIQGLGAGKGWNVVVAGTITLGTKAAGLKSYSFYFTDPKDQIIPAEQKNFTAPNPGQSVKISFKPLGNPVLLRGLWKVHMLIDDGSPTPTLHVLPFTVPPKE